MIFFLMLVQNRDLGSMLEPRSNEYPQSMFKAKNKKKNEYPYKPQFHFIK